MPSSASALTAYRQLLRATRIAFEGDYRVLHAARAEARRQFDENRKPGVDTPMKIQHALETAHILKTNVVQGEKIERSNERGETVDRYCELFFCTAQKIDFENRESSGADLGVSVTDT
ncbi:Mitochondrial zinc maintenance protein 1, mitochondrial [Emydomyces testavorans]|uniref:Mitochondrial zinc maintenance protein 1, mitochondrial n=1 Tax=Emydomyces testavorans TaxID=2070801 RepID=A0AAF0IM69_9EURO|nr:Mitochondrial zinc maintenance protein 1, mitochondrial [Emydomyces testavorans]